MTQLEQVDWDWRNKGAEVDSWEAHGLDCIVLVGPMGSLNGYVRVPESHPWHGLSYSDCVDKRVHHDDFDHVTPEVICSVHGGITYSGKLGEREGHWFGFDTSHSGDFTPGITAYSSSFGRDDTVRTRDYVRQETTNLAEQIARWEASQ